MFGVIVIVTPRIKKVDHTTIGGNQHWLNCSALVLRLKIRAGTVWLVSTRWPRTSTRSTVGMSAVP